jgi:hypothetical protein
MVFVKVRDNHQLDMSDLVILEKSEGRAGSIHGIGYINEHIRTIGKLDQMAVGLNLPRRDIDHGPACFLLPGRASKKTKQKRKDREESLEFHLPRLKYQVSGIKCQDQEPGIVSLVLTLELGTWRLKLCAQRPLVTCNLMPVTSGLPPSP